MKLHSEPSAGQKTISGYGPGFIAVNGQKHTQTLLLDRNTLSLVPEISSWEELSPETLTPLQGRQCDVVLIGTGQKQHFPPPARLRTLLQAGVGVELMDSAAACRTFNILVSEGRNPLALLIVE